MGGSGPRRRPLHGQCCLALTTETPRLALMHREGHPAAGPLEERRPDAREAARRRLPHRAPTGLVSSMHKSVVDTIEHLVTFIEVVEGGGLFVGKKSLPERELRRGS